MFIDLSEVFSGEYSQILQGGFDVVLSRKEGERLVIGDNIYVGYLEDRGKSRNDWNRSPSRCEIVRSELASDEVPMTTPIVKSLPRHERAISLRDFAGSVLAPKQKVG